MAFVYAWIVPLWAAQLLPQFLMEQFDNLRIQCRHNEHMHEGVYNFCLQRFYQNLLSKLRSAGLNYNSPSLSLNLTVRGVSNKHCLLTFFISYTNKDVELSGDPWVIWAYRETICLQGLKRGWAQTSLLG